MIDNKKAYYSLNEFLRNKFNEKVMKISLDGGFSCPNRDGKVGKKGCIFCSERGSGDFSGDRLKSISSQFIDVKKVMNEKWKNGKYIAYFQAYTNTYDTIENLDRKYNEAVSMEGVVCLAIATRPDCIDEEVCKLLKKYNERVYTWVELGFQTSNEKTAELINRGYKNEVYEKAVKLLHEYGIDVVTHIIFGLPEETHDDMIETVKFVIKNKVKGVKFHLLHLIKNTALVKLYNEGRLKFLEQDEYIDLLIESIEMLPKDVVVHRLTGDSPRDLLIGPMWSLKKWEILNEIDRKFKERKTYQGRRYKDEN